MVPPGGEAILVPVKAFSKAKLRLSPALDPERRSELARRLATAVLASTGSLAVYVVCDDTTVARWAESAGAGVLTKPGLGLDGALQSAAWDLVLAGHPRVTVAHADIAVPTGLDSIASSAENDLAILVPDLRRDGTNVLSLPASVFRRPGESTGFAFSYGPGSFRRHLAEAARMGLEPEVLEGTGLSIDIDVPEDLTMAPELT